MCLLGGGEATMEVEGIRSTTDRDRTGRTDKTADSRIDNRRTPMATVGTDTETGRTATIRINLRPSGCRRRQVVQGLAQGSPRRRLRHTPMEATATVKATALIAMHPRHRPNNNTEDIKAATKAAIKGAIRVATRAVNRVATKVDIRADQRRVKVVRIITGLTGTTAVVVTIGVIEAGAVTDSLGLRSMN